MAALAKKKAQRKKEFEDKLTNLEVADTKHAMERMEQRGIDQLSIRRAILYGKKKKGKNGKKLVTFNGVTVVIADGADNKVVVVTTYNEQESAKKKRKKEKNKRKAKRRREKRKEEKRKK